jgi:hypothetical protein
MPPTLGKVAFVVDENLLGLGRAVTHLRKDTVLVGQDPVADLLPKGILDSQWIPILGERGWVMITNDQRLRTRPAEAELAVQHKLKTIHLHGSVGNQPPWAQAVRLLSRWDGIERHLAKTPDGPWWISVRANATQFMGYAPGVVERG